MTSLKSIGTEHVFLNTSQSHSNGNIKNTPNDVEVIPNYATWPPKVLKMTAQAAGHRLPVGPSNSTFCYKSLGKMQVTRGRTVRRPPISHFTPFSGLKRQLLTTRLHFHPSIHWFIHWFVHWFIHPFIHLCIPSSIHSSIYQFTHSLIHSFTHSLIH